MPSILITILSWVSFWINYDASAARVALGGPFLSPMEFDSCVCVCVCVRMQVHFPYPEICDAWWNQTDRLQGFDSETLDDLIQH